MMQKALGDNVKHNRCKLESILWFHLECPKWAEEYDDPIGFKRKFKSLFEEQIIAKLMLTPTPEQDRFSKEFEYNYYPEDIKFRNKIEDFDEVFKDYDPIK